MKHLSLATTKNFLASLKRENRNLAAFVFGIKLSNGVFLAVFGIFNFPVETQKTQHTLYDPVGDVFTKFVKKICLLQNALKLGLRRGTMSLAHTHIHMHTPTLSLMHTRTFSTTFVTVPVQTPTHPSITTTHARTPLTHNFSPASCHIHLRRLKPALQLTCFSPLSSGLSQN